MFDVSELPAIIEHQRRVTSLLESLDYATDEELGERVNVIRGELVKLDARLHHMMYGR